MVKWTVGYDYGWILHIRTATYYVPSESIRLLITQIYFKKNRWGCHKFDKDGFLFNLAWTYSGYRVVQGYIK